MISQWQCPCLTQSIENKAKHGCESINYSSKWKSHVVVVFMAITTVFLVYATGMKTLLPPAFIAAVYCEQTF